MEISGISRSEKKGQPGFPKGEEVVNQEKDRKIQCTGMHLHLLNMDYSDY